EGARGVDERVVDGLEGGDRLPDVEGAGHQHDREHDGGLVESDRDPETVEAERDEQAEPRGCGWKDDRQLDQRDREVAAGEAAGREQVGGRRAEGEDDELGDSARLRRDDERVVDERTGELAEQRSGRGVGEDRDQRERDERERRADDHREPDGGEPGPDQLPGDPEAGDARCGDLGRAHPSRRTLVASTIAVAAAPRRRASSSAAAAVTIAQTHTGPVTIRSTSAKSPSRRTSVTTPLIRLRALSRTGPRSPRRRSS